MISALLETSARFEVSALRTAAVLWASRLTTTVSTFWVAVRYQTRWTSAAVDNTASNSNAVTARPILIRGKALAFMAIGNQTGAAIIANRGQSPTDKHRGAIAETNKKPKMRNIPHQPSTKTRQPDSPEVGNRRLPPDRRQTAKITVAERPDGQTVKIGKNSACRVLAHLLGGW